MELNKRENNNLTKLNNKLNQTVIKKDISTNIQTKFKKEDSVKKNIPIQKNENKNNIKNKEIKEIKNIKKTKKKKHGIFAKGRYDIFLIIISFIIAVTGLVTLLSASSPESLSIYGNSFNYFIRQLKATIIGIVLCTIISLIDYRFYNSKIINILLFLFLISSIVAVEILGVGTKGAKRWIEIAGFTLQLSEFMKIALILLISSYMTEMVKQNKVKTLGSGFLVPMLFIVLISAAVYKLQNHFSAAAVLTIIGTSIMIVGGTNLIYLFTAVILGILTFLGFLNTSSASGGFRKGRIETFFNPWSDIKGKGWQTVQSLYAIASGGLFGLGIGQSRQKRMYLPEAQNDFIFSIFVEEMGYIAAVIMIIVFLILILKSWTISNRCREPFGKLIAIGITVLFTVEIFVNIAVVTKIIPVTGMALPFFSYGGSAIMTSYIALGLLLSISRITNNETEKLEKIN